MGSKRLTRTQRLNRRKAKLATDHQAESKSGMWGKEPGWQWVTRERLDELCLQHRRIVGTRLWHGHRIRYVADTTCGLRAMLSKSRRGPAKLARPEVVLQ